MMTKELDPNRLYEFLEALDDPQLSNARIGRRFGMSAQDVSRERQALAGRRENEPAHDPDYVKELA